MNENIDLTKILKYCPKGWEFYSSVLEEVEFEGIFYDKNQADCIVVRVRAGELSYTYGYTKEGFYLKGKGECTLFPSKDQRDWSKFTAPWYKKEKFDPKTLNPFDRVLVRLTKDCIWNVTFFSHSDKEGNWGCYPCVTTSCKSYDKCIPYNADTKHLLGTSNEAPEYYRYWED